MNVPKKDRVSPEKIAEVFSKNKGNIRATAAELGIERSTVRRKLPAGLLKKPLSGGTVLGTTSEIKKLPRGKDIKRYILTSAQNNTDVHVNVWENLKALALHYEAEILVGSYTYNQNNYGKMSVKLGKD